MVTMNTQTQVIEGQDALQAEVSAVVAVEIAVTNQESYLAANDQIGRLQTMRKAIVEKFAKPKKAAAEAHKQVCALEHEFLDPVDQRITAYKKATTRWYTAEQERIRIEEERRRKEAEEMARLAAEAESMGDTETATEAMTEAIMAEAAVTVMPKVKGTSMREMYRAVVVDINALPREYMIPNQAALDKVAQATKGTIQIPGVRIEKTYINSTRAK